MKIKDGRNTKTIDKTPIVMHSPMKMCLLSYRWRCIRFVDIDIHELLRSNEQNRWNDDFPFKFTFFGRVIVCRKPQFVFKWKRSQIQWHQTNTKHLTCSIHLLSFQTIAFTLVALRSDCLHYVHIYTKIKKKRRSSNSSGRSNS